MRRLLTTLSASTFLALTAFANSASAATDSRFKLPFLGDNEDLSLSATGFSIGTAVGTILNIVLIISGVLAVFYLIFSGVRYITSGGNADAAKAARQGIINAIIGIVVIVSAFVIVRVVASATSSVITPVGNNAQNTAR